MASAANGLSCRTRRAIALAAFAAVLLGGAAAASPKAGACGPRFENHRQLAPLSAMTGEAVAIVVARVSAIEEKDSGRLRTYALDVERVAHGQLAVKQISVVEILGGLRPGAWAKPGERAVVFVGKPPPFSYLKDLLEQRAYFSVIAGRDGFIRVDGDASLAAVEAAVDMGNAVRLASTSAAATAARRSLAFHEIGSANERLVADALLELRSLDSLADSSAGESAAVERMLCASGLSAALRAQVLTVLAEKGAQPLLPILERLNDADPAVTEAALRARARLGAPAGTHEIHRLLRTGDEAVRAAAVGALALTGDSETLAELGRYAIEDPSREVRVAAIDALGATGNPETLAWLEQCFEADSRPVKQASARAILAIGGESADQALSKLATNGRSTDTRVYATALLLTRYSRNHPLIRRIAEADPGAAVRDLIEHGMQPGHVHEQ